MDYEADAGFAGRVQALVAQIPCGKVMTYGQIAGLCGNARASRIVGGIAHYGDPALPWHRVVNKRGGLATGYHGGRRQQQLDLEAEGVAVSDDFYVDIDRLIWYPGGHEEREQ